MSGQPILKSLGVLAAGLLAGGILIALGFEGIGFIVMACAVPVGLVAFFVVDE